MDTATTNTPQRQSWTVHEVAEMLRVSPTTVRRWIKTSKVPAFRVAGSIRIPDTAIAAIFGNTIGEGTGEGTTTA